MSDDSYETINVYVDKVRPKAALLRTEGGQVEWVPRSVMHAGSDRKLSQPLDGLVLLKVRAWKLKELGWI